MAQESRLQELANLKLALSVLAVQLDALEARRSVKYSPAPDEPSDAGPDKHFAQRAVLAMQHLGG
ncbi:hypothetical protein V1279_002903 [Bradyrhizobium sp. AZCC 1610]|uniref:hypothetical protein n=1 Tax=Bradyrhizobium sp. AZCC 1610 TaxID=3117020 RepID=UPI002FEE841D